MEVAGERTLTPGLFDVVAPRAANDSSLGPSFRDCLSPNVPPASSKSAEPSPQRRDPPPQATSSPRDPAESKPAASEAAAADASDDSSGDTQAARPEEDGQDRSEASASDQTPSAAIAVAVVVPQKVLEDPSQPTELEKGTSDKNGTADPAAGDPAEAVATANTQLAAEALAAEATAPAGEPNAVMSSARLHPVQGKQVVAKIAAATRPTEPEEDADTQPLRRTNDPKPTPQAFEATSLVDQQPEEENDADTMRTQANSGAENHPAISVENRVANDTSSPLPAVDPTVGSQAGRDSASPSPPLVASADIAANGSSPKPPPLLRKVKDAPVDAVGRPGDIDPARFLHRVAKAFEAAQQRDSEVRLRLHPAELGSISIEVRVQDNVLTARVHAETPEAKAALIDNLPALRERLADQGIRIDKFDVDLQDHSQRQQQSLQEQAQEQMARRDATPRGTVARSLSTERSESSGPRPGKPGGLNVVV